MIGKIYVLAWIGAIGAIMLTALTGNLNDITATVFGFTFTTLAFAGIVAVLPWWVDRKYSYSSGKE